MAYIVAYFANVDWQHHLGIHSIAVDCVLVYATNAAPKQKSDVNQILSGC